MAIRVKVLYFGQAREAAGSGEETLSLPPRASVRTLVSQATSSHHALAKFMRSMQIAVNEEIADEDDELKEGDVVAFLPPVAGG